MKRDRDRDAAIDRMLGAGLRASAGAADACPQAGDLAAYVEGGLSAPEREAVERHASACLRCQHALALAGSTPVPAGSVAKVRPSVAWLRWAVPAVGVAVVVVLYVGIRSTMLMPQPAGTAPSMAGRAPVAEQLPVARLPVAENRPVSSARTAVPEPATPVKSSPAEAAKRVARADAASATTRDEVRPTTPARHLPAAPAERIAAPQVEARQYQPSQVSPGIAGNAAQFRQQAAGQQAVAQTPTPQAQAQAAPLAAPTAAPVVLNRVESVKVAATPPPTQAKTAVSAQLRAESVRIGERAFFAATPVVIVVPGQSIRWRLESGGGISRSSDGGVTWNLQSYHASASLLAGSAPTATVCWLVGSAGTVLLATDGERWEPRPFPERIDLVGVEARDALHATVTARDGRRFVTDDGGATWRR